MNSLIDFTLNFNPNEAELKSPKRTEDQSRTVALNSDHSTLIFDIPNNRILNQFFKKTSIGPITAWCIGRFDYRARGRDKSLDVFVQDILSEKIIPGSINGQFLILFYNKNTGDWEFWTDRFGTYHAYYTQNSKEVCLSSYFPSVVHLSRAINLDHTAISGFFQMGFFPCSSTWFKDIAILKPASRYVFNTEGTITRMGRYWDWDYNPNFGRKYNTTVDEFYELFNSVISDSVSNKNIAIPVSGGLDSRSTVAALNGTTHKDQIQLFSYGYNEQSIETKIAKSIADKINKPIETFSITPYLFQNLETVCNATECFQDITLPRQAVLGNFINQNLDYVLAAHWGDVWLDDSGLNGQVYSLDNLFNVEMKKFSKRGSQWLLKNYIPNENVNSVKSGVLNIYKDSFEDYKNIQDQDFLLKAFKTDHWSFRWTLSSIRMYQRYYFPILPFYDIRMCDFFSTVPSTFLKGRKLQIDYIKKANPNLAKVEWEKYNYNLYNYKFRKNLLIPHRAIKKVSRYFSSRKKIERNWEVQFNIPSGLKNLQEFLLESEVLFEYFPKNKIEELLVSHKNQPQNPESGYTLSMLLTFCSWIHQITGKPLTTHFS